MSDEAGSESSGPGTSDAGRPDSASRPPSASSGGRRDPPSPEGATRDQRGANEPTWGMFVRDLLASAMAVVLLGAYLFAISGVWPPLVAVESGSMEPNMYRNDLVFVMEENRFPAEGAVDDTGVVTAEVARSTNYRTFGGPGDVIVYKPNGSSEETPIIHRAMFYVEKDERWVNRANEEFLGPADTCDEVASCPADHAGFITKGDANRNYDQVRPSYMSEPVKSEWVVGTAETRVPGLGWLRLRG